MQRVREEWVAPPLFSSRGVERRWLQRREARAWSRQGGERERERRAQDREGAAEEELTGREKRETRAGRKVKTGTVTQDRDCDTRRQGLRHPSYKLLRHPSYEARATRHELQGTNYKEFGLENHRERDRDTPHIHTHTHLSGTWWRVDRCVLNSKPSTTKP
jgi:hypothetical protein